METYKQLPPNHPDYAKMERRRAVAAGAIRPNDPVYNTGKVAEMLLRRITDESR